MRARAAASAVEAPEDGQAVAARARSEWARLIHKVYEVDPSVCAKCGAPMHVIALIDDATVIRRILEHLGCWVPRQVRQYQRAPPGNVKGMCAVPVAFAHGIAARRQVPLALWPD